MPLHIELRREVADGDAPLVHELLDDQERLWRGGQAPDQDIAIIWMRLKISQDLLDAIPEIDHDC